MFLRIQHMPQRCFAGKFSETSLAQNKTVELWRSFMPRRHEIAGRIGSEFYSIDIFPATYFDAFKPTTPFIKWAAVETNPDTSIPEEMDRTIVPEGEYAIFLHKGTVQDAPKTFGYIFGEWLPGSVYKLDDRPHFAVMGDKYQNNNPDSEEEIWIPISKK